MAACGLAAALVASCGRSADAPHGPPDAEFLFAAADSTYWVRSTAEGVRVRSAPILLTRVDGRFYEVFIAEDGEDFEDATFASARIFSRDVSQRDSVSLFDDGRVFNEAAMWKKRHPRDEPIDPESEEAPTDPRTVVSEEIEILDVHGPWVTFNHLLDVDVVDAQPHHHAGHRYVVDVRTGARGSLQSLFGAPEAARLIAAARASFQQLTDSIRTVGDDRAALARETLDSFKFDSTSFGLTDIAGVPAVAFMVPGNGTDGEALALNLPPIAAKSPEWWTAVQPTLPAWAKDSSTVRWPRSTYEVMAQPTNGGESLALSLALSKANAQKWPIATVPAPAYQLIPLDTPPVTAEIHAALARAFDASKALEGAAQTASRIDPARRAPARFRRVQLVARPQ